MKNQTKSYMSRLDLDDANLNPAYMSVKDNPTPKGHEFVCLCYRKGSDSVWRKYVRFATIKHLSGKADETVPVWLYLKLNPATNA